jgi:hypothetical protein
VSLGGAGGTPASLVGLLAWVVVALMDPSFVCRSVSSALRSRLGACFARGGFGTRACPEAAAKHSRRRASNGRGHGEANPCAESDSCYASIRGGFEEQMKRALNDRQRMERDDVIPTQATSCAGAARLLRFFGAARHCLGVDKPKAIAFIEISGCSAPACFPVFLDPDAV